MSKKTFFVVLVLSLVVTYGVSIVDSLINDTFWLLNEQTEREEGSTALENTRI